MSNKTHKNLLVGGAIICLISLPGCMDKSKPIQQDMVTTQDEVSLTGNVLVSMRGKPVVTTDSLAVEKEKFLNLYPQLRQVLPVMDTKEFERNILEQVISQKIVDEYVIANKINETEAYKKDLDAAIENIVRMLNLKHFGESKVVSVSDAEVKAFYDANKDSIPGAMLSQGGIAATGVSFEDAASARSFMAKAKTSGGGFKKAAQDENLNEK